MQLHVLGSAAGGGVPQWNCACPQCTAARLGHRPFRTQASIAASADAKTWVLFNASTDIRAQIEAFAPLRPTAPRTSPIAAVFLTDANVDHVAGILDFRQAAAVCVFSTAAVRDVLLANPMFAPFARSPRSWTVLTGEEVEVAGLRVRAVAVPGLLPSFAGGASVDGAAVAYRVQDAAGAVALYAPIFLEMDGALERLADEAGVAFFDGSFWSDDELAAAGLGTRSARDMGHAPISGAGGSLEAVTRCRAARKVYTHVNKSKTVLDPDSPAARALISAGIEVAQDGETIDVGRSAPERTAHA